MARTNEQELELFADLIDPVAEILRDEAVKEKLQAGDFVGATQVICRAHAKSVIEVLAALDGVPVEDYKVRAITIPKKILAFVNDPEFKELFISPEQSDPAVSSGSATANTEGGE